MPPVTTTFPSCALLSVVAEARPRALTTQPARHVDAVANRWGVRYRDKVGKTVSGVSSGQSRRLLTDRR
jgi:hypothetical protein